jgi:hypothetical protein
VDELLKALPNFGVAGVAIAALVYVIRDRERRLDTWQSKWEEREKNFREQMEAYHLRHEGKAENWAKHLSELALQGQTNDTKMIALLKALLRAIGKKPVVAENEDE